MKRKIIKTIGIVLTIGMMLSLNGIAFASDAEKTGGEKLKEIIESQTKGNVTDIVDQVVTERLECEKVAISDNQKIMKAVELENQRTNEKSYVDYYGGSYINESGNLVIQLCDATEAEQQELQKITSDNVAFEEVANSYESLTDKMERSSILLAELEEKNATGELSETQKKLADNIVGMGTKVEENKNVVYMVDISEEMQAAYFEYFGDESVIFEQSQPIKSSATLMPQGSEILILSTGMGASLGTRMEYLRNNGKYVKGFMTAGHAAKAYGDNVLFVKANGRQVSIGYVIKRQFSGSVDAAFVMLDDLNNYEASRYTKYTNSSGATGELYKMCVSCPYGASPSVGQTVYKSGATTYLTSSQVEITNFTVTYKEDNVTLTNMIKTKTCMSDSGDSGSNVFTKEHGSVYDSVGVLSGAAKNAYTVFCDMEVIDAVWENSQGAPLFQY